ncbi:MAG: aldo/keto reductase, partial [Clostridia bacterium]|nr:aldo/keto reductase [Clostridia bacterium]
QRGQSLAQMALSWVLRDGIVNSALIGASRPEQILDNIHAAENTHFTAEELTLIDQIVPKK